VTFKKKLVVSTIAASMAMTAFAGIPLSTKGLAEKIGIVQVAEAATFSNPTFVSKVNKIHAALEKNESGQASVRAVRDFIASDEFTFASYGSIIDPVWSKISSDNRLGANDKIKLFDIFKAVFSLTYDPTFSELEALKEEHEEFLKGLATQVDGVDNLTVNDLVDFGLLVEQTISSQLAAKSTIELSLILANENNERNDLLKDVLAKARANTTNNFSKVLQGWDNNDVPEKNVTTDDLLSVYTGFVTALNAKQVNFEAAAKALTLAYIRAEGTGSVSNTAASFSVFGKNITSLLQWESSNASIVIDNTPENRGKVTVKSSATTTIKATLLDVVVFEKSVTLGNSYPSTGPVGPGGISSSADQAVQDLNNLKSQIANATGADKDALVQKAVDTAVKALNETLLFKASSKVTVSEGTAKLVLNKSDLNALTSGTKKVVDKLKEIAPGAEAQLPVLEATVDFGTVTAANATIELSADLVKELAAVGISAVNTVVSGFKAKLPTASGFANGVGFTVKKSEAATDLTTLPVASDVYDFELKLGGQVTSVLPAPIQITVPVKNTTGLDADLLTLAKIIEGKLQFVGGKVSGGVITETRHKFSSYVVVENKVSFGDTSSVQSWAGRQIQVLAAKGIINGKKDGVFAPQDNVTRAEFAKMLIEALDLDSETATNKFSDVKAGDWFAPYVAAAAEKGIINGRTATTFVPNATITRAEMATMVARALKATAGLKDVEDVKAALAGFSDASSVHATLEAGVALASSKELIIGSNGKFRPNDTANRAEAAVIIYRAFNYTE